MYTFVAAFTAHLEAHGVPFTRRIDDDFDVLFVNSWAVPFDTVHAAKRRTPTLRVVQRVDGAARDYGRTDDADDRQARVNILADLTIFQSEYSRHSVREKFKVVAQDGPVIYNPADLERFRPDGPRRDLPPSAVRVASVSWSTNRKKGTWQIDQLAADNPDVSFVLCGRFEHVGARPNVHLLGYLGREDLAGVLRASDVFLNLSENDPCPNVVIEALASGLPVVYRRSGGVPELVGECGAALDEVGFRAALDEVRSRREDLARAARARAERLFAPDLIFPQYLDAIAGATRKPMPTRAGVLALAREGYPVTPRRGDRIRGLARRAIGRTPGVRSVVQALRWRAASKGLTKPFRIGWITYDSFPDRKRRFDQLDSFTGMRVGRVAEWINGHSDLFHNELYRSGERYDLVIFQKMMDARCQAEAQAIRRSGGRVVFDANINYYEIWGDYFVPGTQPTEAQQADAIWMTRFADHVVADSSYLAGIIRAYNPHVTWIPDNVNLDVYVGERVHAARRPVRLAWSGIAKKAVHLLLLGDVLPEMTDVELLLVCDERPDCLPELERLVPCRLMTPFSDARHARALLDSDIIISPKRLCNAYELGHTEYKIALGMAVGLPAVASPQSSYVEILSGGGGIIASTSEEWRVALASLCADPDRRADMGARARRTVIDRYSTGVVALRYLNVLSQLTQATSQAIQ